MSAIVSLVCLAAGIAFCIAVRRYAGWVIRMWRRSVCKERLIIFSRYPTPGTTKTRLIPALGEEGAARCQRLMTESLLARIFGDGSSTSGPERAVDIWFSGGNVALMRSWLHRRFPDLVFRPQPQEKDLGVRIAAAFTEAFKDGVERAIIVGADIPGVGRAEIDGAFAAIARRSDGADIVLGPAADGGYYLVGLNAQAIGSLPKLFTAHNIAWGTSDARADTLKAAVAEGLRPVVLETELRDVDEVEDLDEVEVRLKVSASAFRMPKLSIVIPALNEAKNIEATIHSAICGASDPNLEIVIADGGSSDGSIELCESLPKKPWWREKANLRVLAAPRGRGKQLQHGVQNTTGHFVLMLHADSLLPPRYDELLRAALDEPGVAVGAFAFDLDSLSGPDFASSCVELRAKLRFLRWGTNVRARCFELPYGDQALFMCRHSLSEVGGVPDWPLLEDVELVRRLRRLGRVQVLDAPVITNARRWRDKGYIRATGGNQIILIAYALGVSPTTLASWYYYKPKTA